MRDFEMKMEGKPDEPWSRSFPKGCVDGSDWIPQVIDDLLAYCLYYEMPNHVAILAKARRELVELPPVETAS